MEYGLIGEKLGHSYSKEIHNQIGNYNYILKEIPKSELDAFMTAKDFKGINVTIPYKQDVIKYLDFIDENAKEIGAINTIVNRKGKLYGYNTDFIGLKRLILSQNLNLEGKKVLVLGTGGTSHTARTVAKSLKAKEILIVSRKKSENTITYEEAILNNNDAQIILNTTPCGMFPNIDASPIELEKFTQLEGVIDVIYNPLRSKLVIQAQKLGIKAKGGLFMLVQQAIAAAEFFFEKSIEENKAEKIYKNLLEKKQNIVLVGMPGCGKSTIAKELSKSLDRKFYDTDTEITNKERKTPSEIIKEKGEVYFRNIETQVCQELTNLTNSIIATGGGAVLRQQNVTFLKNNGVIFFIDRDIKNIRPTKNRPLSDSYEKLKEVYDKRFPIYTNCADFHIKTDENIEHTIERIKELL